LKTQATIDEEGRPRKISTKGRHDICAIPRINMVCEAMMAIILTDHLLRQNRSFSSTSSLKKDFNPRNT